MASSAMGSLLRWSDRKIADVVRSLEGISETNFVHWTLKAELCAAHGDLPSARACIVRALETWSEIHANNPHFLSEIVVAALVAEQYDIAHDIIDKRLRPDWRFEIQIVDDMFANPYVIEWEIVSRTRSVFRFDAKTYRTDATHIIFVNWMWSFPLFNAYHRFGLAISGKTHMSLGD